MRTVKLLRQIDVIHHGGHGAVDPALDVGELAIVLLWLQFEDDLATVQAGAGGFGLYRRLWGAGLRLGYF